MNSYRGNTLEDPVLYKTAQGLGQAGQSCMEDTGEALVLWRNGRVGAVGV